jgi:hypothetical protein
MFSVEQLRQMEAFYQQRMEAVSTRYLTEMGEHLKDIGQLIPSDVHRLVEMRRAGTNVEMIQRTLARAANISASEVEALFMAIAREDYRFTAQYYVKSRQLPFAKNAQLIRLVRAQAMQTAAGMANLSQTTIASTAYKKAIDAAVHAAQTGVADYQSAIRGAMRQAAQEGLRVQFPSGRRGRLDTVIRQNVLDGARQLQREVMRQVGAEFGSDGVEISAHAICAEDHLPYQGKQFSNDEFEKLQASLKREIGQWNCRHTAHPILLGVSEPAYDDDELAEYRRRNEERTTIDGITKTRYEWTQEQRRIETATRYLKDEQVIARAAGDGVLRRDINRQIGKLDERYVQISRAAELPLERERMRGTGFQRAKAGEIAASKMTQGERSVYYRALHAEPEITAAMKKFSQEAGAELSGLEFRIKTADSFMRKCKADSIEKGISLSEAAESVFDTVRYTVVAETASVYQKARRMLDMMRGEEYTVIVVKDTLSSTSSVYRGVNVKLTSPGGQKFELQFHTLESLTVKDKIHGLYEQQRVLDPRDSRWRKLAQEMLEASQLIPVPPGADSIR